eukprot:COSAG02_NODE_1029_length_15083_cov_8.066271_9_plen_65_part_00
MQRLLESCGAILATPVCALGRDRMRGAVEALLTSLRWHTVLPPGFPRLACAGQLRLLRQCRKRV